MALEHDHLRLEIGYTWYSPAVWGTGVNAEAKLLLLRHAFETLGARRVEFKTDARNERSRGALIALGAQFEGVFRKHMVLSDGGARDSAYYAIVDDEWPAVRARLEERLARY
jgi:RimJ/RimL family protein N-acetyltransferase